MHLEPGRLYVFDRGFRDFRLYQNIVDADSSFVARMGDNAVYEVLEEKVLTPEAQAAGVISDRIVRLGGRQVREKFDRPVRRVEVYVPQKAPRGLGYPVKQVNPKTKTYREATGQAMIVPIATDRLDLPADVIALIYLHRQKVELFFRFLKAVLGCRHLLSDSIEGISVQVYCALIATLLLAEYTGLAVSKRTFTLVVLYLQGWVQEHELVREIVKLKEKTVSKKS
jgi:IS4 transposase